MQWPSAQAPVYANRRRKRGKRGKALPRTRAELVERSFAHVYDTGGMRRTHLRRHDNILKRLLIHAGAFNLGLMMRHLYGVGKPRRLQGALAAGVAALGCLCHVIGDLWGTGRPQVSSLSPSVCMATFR
jgi:transposase